ncbi:2-nitropropane dioxygenase [Gymnopilus junonius]|uniref:2-nitropropane dioxygenase n=1 Tax=Gymnopilus junonius TaxID=109634 RepID=A0A9P5TT87_GYMJU|nr:2-nitropropane dioxygenase [Gymnopilus junonius]
MRPDGLRRHSRLGLRRHILWRIWHCGPGFDASDMIKQDLKTIREKLAIPPERPVPVGVGFIGWILDMVPDESRLEQVLDEKPVALWLAFGVDLGKYVARIRAHDNKRAQKTIIFVIVNSVEMALKAANEWKVDIVVVQGTEAGGHGGSESPPLLSLLPAVLDAIPQGPLVVAAGGVSNGRQIAALLTAGANGVVLGTRFLFTPECKYNSDQKNALLKAGLNDTVRTLAYDEVGQTNYWPPKHNGRAICNKVMDDFNEGLDLETRLKRFEESAAAGETSRLIVWAGVGVGLTNKILPASDVVSELEKEALAALGAGSKLA